MTANPIPDYHPGLPEKLERPKPSVVSWGHRPPWWNDGELPWLGKSPAAWQPYLCSTVFRVANNYYPVLIMTVEELQAIILK